MVAVVPMCSHHHCSRHAQIKRPFFCVIITFFFFFLKLAPIHVIRYEKSLFITFFCGFSIT